jgi:hypothetical protein
MWVDETANKIYRWGGWFPFHNDARDNDTALWELNPDGIGGGEWAIREPSTSSDFDGIWMGGDGAWTSCDGRGFYIGGLGNKQTDSRFEADRYHEATPIPGQLTYDMSSGNWHNDTIGEITGFSSPYGTHVRGRAVCSQDFGQDPLVFVLGGHQTELDLTSHSTFNDIMQVNFFNAKDRTWHSQKTTAHNDDVPPKRVRFCAAGATSTNGTYDMYVALFCSASLRPVFLGSLLTLRLVTVALCTAGKTSGVRRWTTCGFYPCRRLDGFESTWNRLSGTSMPAQSSATANSW